jgi:hypothetical protein
MATAAAMFALEPGREGSVTIRVPMGDEVRRLRHDRIVGAAQLKSADPPRHTPWTALERQTASLQLPDPKWQWLYQQSARTLLLLSPHAVFPGPYVYRRFWYRDACLMLHALLAIGHGDRCRRVIEEVFPQRQRRDGFFESQEGEWDSNGQVLWIAAKVAAATGRCWSQTVVDALAQGVRWLEKKRLPEDGGPQSGLLPAGFSAEHLGPNNFYYWDNFWAVAGLREAAAVFDDAGRPEVARQSADLAEAYARSIERSLESLPPRVRAPGALPAAPGRRMDAGAVGSLVADYPLHLEPPGSPRIAATARFLLQHCMVHGAFFQDMTHSGLNPYLTLHLAQVLLRGGDPQHAALIDAVADLATDTGVWPEAVHPATGGGVIGDGQHGWAAAEWCLMMRALLIREEQDQLVVGPGVRTHWLDADEPICLGATPTRFGTVNITLRGTNGVSEAIVEGDWHAAAPSLRLAIPGCEPAELQPGRPHRLRRLSDAHRDVHQHLRTAGRRD